MAERYCSKDFAIGVLSLEWILSWGRWSRGYCQAIAMHWLGGNTWMVTRRSWWKDRRIEGVATCQLIEWNTCTKKQMHFSDNQLLKYHNIIQQLIYFNGTSLKQTLNDGKSRVQKPGLIAQLQDLYYCSLDICVIDIFHNPDDREIKYSNVLQCHSSHS